MMNHSSLGSLKGIGETLLRRFSALGINSIRDLVYHFPRKFIDRRKQLKIADLHMVESEDYFCVGRIQKLAQVKSRTGRKLITGVIIDDTGEIDVIWFNSPHVLKMFRQGDEVVFSGLLTGKRLINPKIRKLQDLSDLSDFAKLEPVYSETRGLGSAVIAKFVKQVFERKLFREKDELPNSIVLREQLMEINFALECMHFPQDKNSLEEAKKRIAFDEIYQILLQVKEKKDIVSRLRARPMQIDENLHQDLLSKIPFQLTESQSRAIQDIYCDIQKSIPMHRLVNGDVGSGKTIVAAFAAFQVLRNNLQVVLLAPTGVLASQHYDLFARLLSNFDIELCLITAATTNRLKKSVRFFSGSRRKPTIFIGTHALLHNVNLLDNVGLVVIDEQHKFGVKQREILEFISTHVHGLVPHVLSMSATPIPRTLALTLYGDLEVSVLHKPSIRRHVITKCIYDIDMQRRMYEWIRKHVSTSRQQVYVVCPLIEESEKSDAQSAMKEYERLKYLYPELKVALLHGKMKNTEKEKIISEFKDGEIDILVSTSVVEVGVDNPNATIMIIEGAERFGLAQLHQIRGRVGRSDKQSYCFLKTTGNIRLDRLEFFAQNHDGFSIAEFDLQYRGPGEVYGEAQSGIPKLKVASIFDVELIKKVKNYIGI